MVLVEMQVTTLKNGNGIVKDQTAKKKKFASYFRLEKTSFIEIFNY